MFVTHAPAKSSGDAEQGQRAGAVAGVVTVGGGDGGDAGEAERADRGVAEGGHDLRSGAGADPAAVFVVGDVTDPVDGVLDVPVAADPGGQPFRLGLVHAQAGDGVDGLGGAAVRLVQAAPAAADPQGLGG